jgi:hypothetical protein
LKYKNEEGRIHLTDFKYYYEAIVFWTMRFWQQWAVGVGGSHVKHTPAKQYREPKNIPKQLYPIGF